MGVRGMRVPRTPFVEGTHWIVDPETGCWEWQQRRDHHGYGKWPNGQAHRAIYRQFGHDLDDELDLHHCCENKGCVNPAHMEPRTKVHHEREHWRERLEMSDQQREEIRRLGRDPHLTQQQIADLVGIPRPTVNKLLNGYSWFDGERVLPERDCRGCGETFTGTNRRQRYCSTCRPRRAAA